MIHVKHCHRKFIVTNEILCTIVLNKHDNKLKQKSFYVRKVVNAKYSAGKVSCIEHQKLSFGTNAKRNFFDIKVDYIDMILVRNNL